MAGRPPPRELDGYRERADRFIAAMLEEYYLHFAGHKDELDIEPIYERYAELTTLDAANGVGAARRTATAASGSSGGSPAAATSAT